jgi:membrane associated rhomboid family serine protease
MFIPIPMEISNLRSVDARTKPVANWILIAVNVLGYLFLSPGSWAVGPHSAPWTVVTYGFVHVGWWHLLFNVWYLWVFGNPVNRRIGNGYYLVTYLGTITILGILGRMVLSGTSVGASGAVFAIIAVAGLLMPASRVEMHYVALFPITVLMGLVSRPKYWLFWIIRWGRTHCRALWLCALYPILEVTTILWCGLSWTNLGHMGGFLCGVAAVLMLPTTISMGRRTSYATA